MPNATREDLTDQARPGQGIPSQDPNPAAQIGLEPEEAEREAVAAWVGGASVGATIGVVRAAAAPGNECLQQGFSTAVSTPLIARYSCVAHCSVEPMFLGPRKADPRWLARDGAGQRRLVPKSVTA